MPLVSDERGGSGGSFNRVLGRVRDTLEDLEIERRKREEEERRRREEEERRARQEAARAAQEAARRAREAVMGVVGRQDVSREGTKWNEPFGKGKGGGIGGQVGRLGKLGEKAAKRADEQRGDFGLKDVARVGMLGAAIQGGKGHEALRSKDVRQSVKEGWQSANTPLVKPEELPGPEWLRRGVSGSTSPAAIALTTMTGGIGKGALTFGKNAAADVLGNIGYEATGAALEDSNLPWYVKEPLKFGGAVLAGSTPYTAKPLAKAGVKGIDRLSAFEARLGLQPELGQVTLPTGRKAAAKALEEQGAIAKLGDAGSRKAITERDQTLRTAGTIGRAAENVPGYKRVAGAVSPGQGMDRDVFVGNAAMVSAKADVNTRLATSRRSVVQRFNEVFGGKTKDADGYVRLVNGPQYVGPADNPIAGTVLDIAENPQDYVLNPAQRAALEAVDAHNSGGINLTRGEYAVDVLPYTPKNEGAIYAPHVDTNEDTLAALDRTSKSISQGQVGKERSWDTARERMAHDPKFKPETDLELLLAHHDQALASAAGERTFLAAVPGKTRVEVMDELHPGLRQTKEKAAKKVASLRGKIATAQKQTAAAKGADALTARETKRLEARMAPIQERVDEMVASGEYGEELSHLAGQLYEANLELVRLQKTAGRGTVAAEKVASLDAALKQAENDWHALVKRYRNANPGTYVQNQMTRRWYEASVSQNIDEIRKVTNGPTADRILSGVDTVRNTVLSGDLSPLFIQGLLNLARAPRTFVTTSAKMAKHWSTGLDDVARREPELVSQFVRARGRALGQVDPEFQPSHSLFAKIPGLGSKAIQPTEQWMLNMLARYEYETWKVTRGMLMKHGHSEVDAAYEAANALSKSVPGMSSVDRGVSPARAAIERAPITSVSFATAPAAMMKDAASGIVKAVTGQPLRGRERVALVHLSYMAGTLATVSAVSAVLTAKDRGLSPEEAVKRSLTPGKREFLSLHLWGGRNAGLGGPFRSFVVAMAPQYRDGEWQAPNPMRWATSKLNPVVGTTVDLIKDRDFLGYEIRGDGPAWEQVLRTVEYMAEGALLPISIGNVAEAGRRMVNNDVSTSLGEQIENFFSGLGGANVSRPSSWESFDEEVRKSYEGRHFGSLKEWEQEEALAKFGKPKSPNPEVNKRREEYDAFKEQQLKDQLEDDAKQAAGELKGGAAEYRRRIQERGLEEAAFGKGLYAVLPGYADRQVTPLDEYWALAESTKEGNGGRVDWDKVEELVAAKSSDWQVYVQEYFDHHVREGTPLQKQLWEDQAAIKESGYWDIERGKTQFLRDNPAVREKVEKWGYSESVVSYLKFEDKMRAEQNASDSMATTGGIRDMKTWRDDYYQRRDKLVGAREVLWGDMKEEAPTGPVEEWFREITKNKGLDGKVNWDAVDRWTQSLPEDARAAIDGYESQALTPTVAEYKKAANRIGDSGYWKIGDDRATAYARNMGLTGVTSMEGLRQAVWQKKFDEYVAAGQGFWAARERADTYADKKLRRLNALVTRQRQVWRRRNTKLAGELAYWGFWDPGAKDTSRILAS
jgi:hypothetical protein